VAPLCPDALRNWRIFGIGIRQSREIDTIELKREIPHDTLREKYEEGMNIWDLEWVLKNEDEPARS
jgi:hypothetical protein